MDVDKENSACNQAQPIVTPSKGGALQASGGGDGPATNSSRNSPADQGQEPFREQHNPIFASPFAVREAPREWASELRQSTASLASQLREMQLALAASEVQQQQPVTVVFNIVDTGGRQGSEADASQQLQRSEGLLAELSKEGGKLKGRIAKLEGAVAAGESKVRAQAQELETLKGANKALEQQLRQAELQIGVTPERARSSLRELQEKAGRAEDTSTQQAQRIARLQSVLAYDGGERADLQEFTALEYDINIAEERSLQQEAAELRAAGQLAAAELAEARGRLAETEGALQQRGAEAQALQQQVAECREALAAATAEGAEWRQRAEQFDRDRQQAAVNVRKAEREVDLIAQENAGLFRQVNYVSTRLRAQLPQLEAAVPDVAKLARELQAWCEREAAYRGKGSGLTPR